MEWLRQKTEDIRACNSGFLFRWVRLSVLSSVRGLQANCVVEKGSKKTN